MLLMSFLKCEKKLVQSNLFMLVSIKPWEKKFLAAVNYFFKAFIVRVLYNYWNLKSMGFKKIYIFLSDRKFQLCNVTFFLPTE